MISYRFPFFLLILPRQNFRYLRCVLFPCFLFWVSIWVKTMFDTDLDIESTLTLQNLHRQYKEYTDRLKLPFLEASQETKIFAQADFRDRMSWFSVSHTEGISIEPYAWTQKFRVSLMTRHGIAEFCRLTSSESWETSSPIWTTHIQQAS